MTVYPAGSNGNVAPSSTIAGSNTGLAVPAGIALDASGNIYVTNDGSETGGPYTVTVYPAGSTGNVAPSLTIGGSNTGLSTPIAIALDGSGNIYVANYYVANRQGGTVTIYPAGGNGNVAPSAIIAGPATELDRPSGIAILPGYAPGQLATPMPSATPTATGTATATSTPTPTAAQLATPRPTPSGL